MYTTSLCKTPLEGCIHAAAAGFPSELVQTFASRVFTLARHITQNDRDAERVLIETFLQLCGEPCACEDEQDLWITLVTIAVQETFSALHQRVAASQSGPGADCREDLVVRELSAWRNDVQRYFPEETTQVLEAGLRRLDPMARTVFVLRDMEQISIAQIAEILNRSVPAIEVCLMRARLELRENLAPHMRLLQ